MKHLLYKLTILLLLSFFIRCKKDNQDNFPNPTGTWEASKEIGGESQGSIYNPGNGNVFKFTDSTFHKYQVGQLIDSGTYDIIKEKYEDFAYRLILNSNYNSQLFIKVIDNEFILSQNGFYRTVTLYIRIP